MRAAHGLGIAFALAVGALSGALALAAGPRGNEDPAHPDQGLLAPLPPRPPGTEPVARLGGEEGSVVDLAASGEALAVLTRHRWFILTADSLLGGFGDPNPGSPDWLSRAESIALGEGRVYILDAGRFTLSVWDRGGVRLEDIPLSAGDSHSFQPTQVVVGSGGEPVVLSLVLGRDGTGRWEARAYGGEEPGRVVFSHGESGRPLLFDRLHLATAGRELLGANALTHGVFRAAEGSEEVVPVALRSAPPLWLVPRRTRESYNTKVFSGGVEGHPDLFQLPPFWPSVRDFTVTPEGAFLLAVTAGEDRQHLELLAPDGSPLWRFNEDGFPDPVFLDGGRAFLVKEELNETVIHEFVLRSF